MNYSFNELDGLVRKAAMGAGFPPGHAAAVATAGIWLARRRFRVCEVVSRAIADGMPPSTVDRQPSSMIFRNARSAADGPAAIDLSVAMEPATDIVLQQLDEPVLLLGLAGAAAEALQIDFTIAVGQQIYRVAPLANISPDGFTLTGGADITLRSTATATAAAAPSLATRYDPAAIGDTGWSDLVAFAAKTYVPATDQSRLQGAGAGLTDND